METILVVEDDPRSGALLGEVCDQEGHPIVLARSEREARAALAENNAGLVLLDLRLPDGDGIALMKQIQALVPTPDVIIITGHASLDSALAAIEAGASGYVLKPIDIPRLRALVGKILGQRRLREENVALHGRIEQERRRLEALYEMSRRLASVQNPDQILDLIVREATRLLDVEAAAIRLMDGEDLVLRACTESVAPLLTRRRLKVGESLTGCVAASREPIAVPDLVDDARYDPIHKQAALSLGFHAFLGVPLLASGNVLGTLSVYGRERRSFHPDDVLLLTTLGNHAALTLDRAGLFQQERERRGHLEALRTIAEEITRELELPRLLDLIMRRATELLGSDMGSVYFWDEAGRVLIPQVWQGHGGWEKDLRLRPGEGVAGAVAQRRTGLIVNDFRTSPYATPALLAATTHTAVLAEPLQCRDRLLGVITIDKNDGGGGGFSVKEQQLLRLFATQAAIAIENARLHEATKRRALHLATLNELSRSLTSILDPHQVSQRILTFAQALIGGCVGRLWERTGEEGALRLVGGVGLRDPEGGQSFRFREGLGLLGLAAATHQPVTSLAVTEDPRFLDKAWAETEGLVSACVVPLVLAKRVTGFLSIFTSTPHHFCDDELDLLRSFAAQAAVAIENARLFEETQAQRVRLAEVFESAVEGIFQAVPAGGYLAANRAFLRILGYESLEELQGAVREVDQQVYADSDRRAVFHRLITAQGSVSAFESEVVRRNGTAVWIEENTRAVTSAAGEIRYYEGFVQDISERKQAEQMKADFVSFVTHQLRTPLAGIKWLLELALQGSDLAEEIRSYLLDAQCANARLIGLVNDLLDVSRLERGKLTITPKEVDLGSLTQDVLGELRLLIAEKGHQLTLQAAPSLDTVWADPQPPSAGHPESDLQCHQVHSVRRRDPHPIDPGHVRRPVGRPRQRHRHPESGPDAALRKVLPGGERAYDRDRRHGAWSLPRPPDPGSVRGAGLVRIRRGARSDVLLHGAFGGERTV